MHMDTPSVPMLEALVSDLRAQLEDAESRLSEASARRDSDPVEYLGRIFFANTYSCGSPRVYGENELQRARKLLEISDGDVIMAEDLMRDRGVMSAVYSGHV